MADRTQLCKRCRNINQDAVRPDINESSPIQCGQSINNDNCDNEVSKSLFSLSEISEVYPLANYDVEPTSAA